VRFGPTTILVEIVDAAAANDLPAAYEGVPVVLHQRFKDPSDSDSSTGFLADL
jgi:hypothetical protein